MCLVEIKKGGIAPLQPAVLAAFRPWGIERGAGRTATAKIGKICPTPIMGWCIASADYLITRKFAFKWLQWISTSTKTKT
jgi:hypothetical protein